MSIYTIEIPDDNISAIQGDTIDSWSVEFEPTDGISLTGATIKMQVFWNNTKEIDLSDGSGITIDSDLKFTIDERSRTQSVLPEGQGIGDLQILDANDKLITMFRVQYNIAKQYTTG